MNKQDAEMWARVARRIGLSDVAADRRWTTDDGTEVFGVYYSHGRFDPPAKPADERMLWDYVDTLPEVFVLHRTSYSNVHANKMWTVRYGFRELNDKAESRVTALGRAIDRLPA